jgi:HSP20 family molecular chaperone IbpA
MFERVRCRECGEKVKRDWRFCPYCGRELFLERDIFGEIAREFKRIDKLFESSFFRFPSLKPLRGGGISIVVRSGTGMKPEIKIRTSGEYKKLEPELRKRLGVKKIEGVPQRIPRVTEEPRTELKKIARGVRIEVELPGVRNERDIEIRKLEQSIEIKAWAGDKAYFKLIPIPKELSVLKKEFKDGLLKIELG